MDARARPTDALRPGPGPSRSSWSDCPGRLWYTTARPPSGRWAKPVGVGTANGSASSLRNWAIAPSSVTSASSAAPARSVTGARTYQRRRSESITIARSYAVPTCEGRRTSKTSRPGTATVARAARASGERVTFTRVGPERASARSTARVSATWATLTVGDMTWTRLPLSRSTVDRGAERRGDPTLIPGLLEDARTRVLMVRGALVPVRDGPVGDGPVGDRPVLDLRGPGELGARVGEVERWLYLGTQDDVGYLAAVLRDGAVADVAQRR